MWHFSPNQNVFTNATEKRRECQDKPTAYGIDVMTWIALSRYKALFRGIKAIIVDESK